jgi:hypothetical protein
MLYAVRQVQSAKALLSPLPVVLALVVLLAHMLQLKMQAVPAQ